MGPKGPLAQGPPDSLIFLSFYPDWLHVYQIYQQRLVAAQACAKALPRGISERDQHVSRWRDRRQPAGLGAG
jgi:hypothetical protein